MFYGALPEITNNAKYGSILLDFYCQNLYLSKRSEESELQLQLDNSHRNTFRHQGIIVWYVAKIK